MIDGTFIKQCRNQHPDFDSKKNEILIKDYMSNE